MLISGKSPSIGTPTLWKTASGRRTAGRRGSSARTARRAGARASGGRAAAGRARASPWPPCERGSRARTSFRRVAGRPRRDPRRRCAAGARPGSRSARIRPSRRSRSRSQRAASSITWLETSSVVPPSASSWKKSQRSRRSTGSRPTVGSSSTSTLGLVEERRCERDARPLPAREPPDEVGGHVGEADTLDHLVDAHERRAEHAREVRQVLAHREVAVDRRRLRHVADAAPQRGGAGREPEHAHVTRGDDLHPDDRTASGSTCRCRSGRAGPSRRLPRRRA